MTDQPYRCEMYAEWTGGRCDRPATKVVVDNGRSVPVCDHHYAELAADPDVKGLLEF